MDKKDQRILAELLLNSRIPLTVLAKRVGLSREVITYRMNRLVKGGAITNFYAMINHEALGFFRYPLALQLKNISSEKERQFFDYLKKHKFATYAGSTVGKWNITFDVLAKNPQHLERIIKEILGEVSDYVENYLTIQGSSEQEFYPQKMLGESKTASISKPSVRIELDRNDKTILKLLTLNSRIEYKELADKLHMSANAIKYRVKNLEKAGVITGYTISIDSHKFGFEMSNIQIKLYSQDDKSPMLIKKFARNSKKAIYFYHYFGNENYDFDIGILAKNALDLRDFILELRNTGVPIKIHDLYTLPEVIRPDIAPEGIFE